MKEHGNTIYLFPGELVITRENKSVWTILGSCVSIIFYCEKYSVSAVSHAQLPGRLDKKHACFNSCPHPCFNEASDTNDFKFVTCSMSYMLEKFQRMGIRNTEIQASLYGGSNVMPSISNAYPVGDKNIAAARRMIEKMKLSFTREDVGGPAGRTLIYSTRNGEIQVRYHRKSTFEQAYGELSLDENVS